MPDDLYHRDFVLWSERQAEALRRLQRGERVNDLDWANLIEEVEGLGRSETRAVSSLLVRALEHLLKTAAWPESASAPGWRHEAGVFLRDAKRGWTPSMDQQLELPALYTDALANVRGLAYREGPPGPLPEDCPFTLRDLLPRDGATPDAAALIAKLRLSP
jgi:hypothetical protein